MKTRVGHAAALSIMWATLHATQVGAGGRDPAAADVLFREGRALMKNGDFKAACPKLAESQRLDPAPGTAINLGDCVEKLGKLADALQAYRDAMDLLPAGDRRIQPVGAQVAALEKRVPRLVVKLASGAPEGTRVTRGDVELGTESLGVALPVNPGEHWVVVEAPERQVARQKIALSEGQVRELLVAPGERLPPTRNHSAPTPRRDVPRAAPNAAATIEPTQSHGSKTTALVLGGIGVAALAFAGVAFFETNQYEQQSQDAHGSGDGETGRAKFNTAETWNTVGIVSLVGGGAALAIGGALWIFDDAQPRAAGGRGPSSVSLERGTFVLEGRW